MVRQPRVLFVHYRSGERDGVSLEIENRARIFTSLGAQVFYLSGFDGLRRPQARTIPLIDLRASYNTFLRENAFYQRLFDESTMLFLYTQLENKFASRVDKYLQEINPDLIFVHNVFSHAYNLPFTTALLQVLDVHQVPTVAVNHDFWFDRGMFNRPKYPFIRRILASLPPNRPYILKHQTINSLATQQVLNRRQIHTETIGDYFDFHLPLPAIGDKPQRILGHLGINPDDLIILHATRITERKAIELAIAYAAKLQKKIHSLTKPFTFQGKSINRRTRVTMLFPNFIEVDAIPYWDMLREYADRLGVKTVWAFEEFSVERRTGKGLKTFSYWDSYAAADLVTYTSVAEGFGNQFLEAAYYRKLPILFEYPVFLQDLKPEGYRYISLGSRTRTYKNRQVVSPAILTSAAVQTLLLLQDQGELNSLTDHNFQLGRQFHPTTKLRQDLSALLRSLKR